MSNEVLSAVNVSWRIMIFHNLGIILNKVTEIVSINIWCYKLQVTKLQVVTHKLRVTNKILKLQVSSELQAKM
jgi:hypothetical protein